MKGINLLQMSKVSLDMNAEVRTPLTLGRLNVAPWVSAVERFHCCAYYIIIFACYRVHRKVKHVLHVKL